VTKRRQTYEAPDITVTFDPDLCIHSGVCVRGLRAVFDVEKRPWVNVEGASAEAIAEQIKRCPSGALSYELPEDNPTARTP